MGLLVATGGFKGRQIFGEVLLILCADIVVLVNGGDLKREVLRTDFTCFEDLGEKCVFSFSLIDLLDIAATFVGVLKSSALT